VRVYLANVWINNRQFDRIAASIRAADPDVLVLLEFGTSTRASG